MNNTDSYLRDLVLWLNKITLAKIKISDYDHEDFKRGEQIVTDRIFHKQVPEILKRLIRTLQLEDQIGAAQNGEQETDLLILVSRSISEHPELWNMAIHNCQRKSLITISIAALEKAAVDAIKIAKSIKND